MKTFFHLAWLLSLASFPAAAFQNTVADDPPITIDVDTVIDLSVEPATVAGDTDLAPFFRADKGAANPHQWRAVLDFGQRDVVVEAGVTIRLETLVGGHLPALDVLTGGSFTLKGELLGEANGGRGGDWFLQTAQTLRLEGRLTQRVPSGQAGTVTLVSCLNNVVLAPGSAIHSEAETGGAVDIRANGETGDIRMAGTVEVVHGAGGPGAVRVHAGRDLYVDGSRALGTIGDNGRRLYAGIVVRSALAIDPGSIHLQAVRDIRVLGNGYLPPAEVGNQATFHFQDSISNSDIVPVTVVLEQVDANTVAVDLAIASGDGDLLGFFGNVSDGGLVSQMRVSDEGGVVTQSEFKEDKVRQVGGGNNVNPARGWDFGIKLDQQGAGGGKIERARFHLSGPGLSIAHLASATQGDFVMGVRIQSTNGGEGSAKIGLPGYDPTKVWGTIAVKTNPDTGKAGEVGLAALQGDLYLHDRAVDIAAANGGDGIAYVLAHNGVALAVSNTQNGDGSAVRSVIDARGEGGAGSRVRGRAYQAGFTIGAGAEILATGSPVGNIDLLACDSVNNGGRIEPSDRDASNDRGSCADGPGPFFDPIAICTSADLRLQLSGVDGAPLNGEWVNSDQQTYRLDLGRDVVQLQVVSTSLTSSPAAIAFTDQVGFWTATLEEGEHLLVFEAYDRWNNKIDRSLTLRIDRTPPVVTFGDLPTETITSQSWDLAATVSDALSGVAAGQFRDNVANNGDVAAVIDGPTRWQWHSPRDGFVWELVGTATDLAGNEGRAEAEVGLTFDYDFDVQPGDNQSPVDGRWVNGLRQIYDVTVGRDVERVVVTSPSFAEPQQVLLENQRGELILDNFEEGAHVLTFQWYGVNDRNGDKQIALGIDRTGPTVDWQVPDEVLLLDSAELAALVTDPLSGLAGGQFSEDQADNPTEAIRFDETTVWSWSTPANGTHWTIRLSAIDVAGNPTETAIEIPFLIDLSYLIESRDADSPRDGTWVNSTVQTYDITLGRDVRGLRVDADVFPARDLTIDNQTAVLSLQDVPDGRHTIRVTTIGPNGESKAYPFPLNIDRQGPEITWDFPENANFDWPTDLAATVSDVLSGVADGEFTESQAGNQPQPVALDGVTTWQWMSPQIGTTWTISVRARDQVGNVKEDSFELPMLAEVFLDIDARDVNSPSDGSWTNSQTQTYDLRLGRDVRRVVVDSTVTGPVDLPIADQTAVFQADGWPEGSYDIVFTYYDPNDVPDTERLTLRIDRTPPTVSWALPATAGFDLDVELAATVSDTRSGVGDGTFAETQAGNTAQVVAVDGVTQWLWRSPDVGLQWSIELSVRDVAGNVLNTGETIELVPDLQFDIVGRDSQSPTEGQWTNSQVQTYAIQLSRDVRRLEVAADPIGRIPLSIDNQASVFTVDNWPEGSHPVIFYYFGPNDESAEHPMVLRIDRTPPTVVWDLSVSSGLNEVVALAAAVTDAQSGLSGGVFQDPQSDQADQAVALDGPTQWQWTSPGEGVTWTIDLSATDQAGNQLETSESIELIAAVTLDIASADEQSPLDGTWVRGNRQAYALTLGKDVNRLEVSSTALPDSPRAISFADGTGLLELLDVPEGSHVIEVVAYGPNDLSDRETFTLRIDRTSPVVTWNFPEQVRLNENVNLAATVTDAASGLASGAFHEDVLGYAPEPALDGVETQWTWQSPDVGEAWVITLTATDQAGNETVENQPVPFLIELDLLVIGRDADSPTDGSWVRGSTQIYDLQATRDVRRLEAVGDVLAVSPQPLTLIDGVSALTLEDAPEGEHRIVFNYYGPNDELGSKDLWVNIDRTPPTVTWNLPESTGFEVVTDLAATVQDPLSGVVSGTFGEDQADNQGVDAVLDGETQWQWTSPALGTEWKLLLTATDAAGNRADLDRLLPLVPDLDLEITGRDADSPTDESWTRSETQTYDVAVTKDVRRLEVSGPSLSSSPQALTLTDRHSVFSQTGLDEGEHLFTFTAYGPNDEPYSESLLLKIDRTAPEVVWTVPDKQGLTMETALSALVTDPLSGVASGTFTDSSGTNASQSAILDGPTDWSWVSPDAGATWELVLTTADGAGNETTHRTEIELETELFLTVNGLDEDSPRDGRWINSQLQRYEVLVGRDVRRAEVASDALSVSPQDIPLFDGRGAFQQEGLPEGEHLFVFHYYGPNDETEPTELILKIDRTPPTVTWDTPETVGFGANVDLMATLEDSASGVASGSFMDEQGSNEAVTAALETVTEWAWVSPSDGDLWTLSVHAEDAAGNVLTESHPIGLQAFLNLEITGRDEGSPTNGRWVNSETQTYDLQASPDVVRLEVVSESLDSSPQMLTLDGDNRAVFSQTGLAEGRHHFEFTIYDAAENSQRKELLLNIDRTAPTLTFTDLGVIDYNQSVAFTVTAADNLSDVVQASIQDDFEQLHEYSDNLTMTFTWTSPAEGETWLLHLRAEDEAGNVLSDNKPLPIGLDLSFDLVGLDGAPTDGQWVNTAVQAYEIQVGVDVTAVTAQSPITGAEIVELTDQVGFWSADNDPEGTHEIQFEYTGPNNFIDDYPLTLKIDRTKPTFTWSPPTYMASDTPIDLSGVLADNLSGIATAQITDDYNDPFNYTDSLDMAWQWTSPPSGTDTWVITVTATDIAGNQFRQDYEILIDYDPNAEPLTLVWDAPANGFVTKAPSVVVSGRILSGVATALTINDQAAQINGGTFQLDYPLPDEGLQWLTLRATGADGTDIVDRRQLVVDRTAPDIQVLGGLLQDSPHDSLIVSGQLFDVWDPRPRLTVPSQPQFGEFVRAFQLAALPREAFPLVLAARDHVDNISTVTVDWQPDPNKGILVDLSALPTVATTGGEISLEATAQPLSESPVRDISLYTMREGSWVQIAAADQASLRYQVAVPNRTDLAEMRFAAVAYAMDGSTDRAETTVPIMGDVLLEGRVYDADTGHPIVGAEILLQPGNATLNTDGNGHYRYWLTEPVEHILVSVAGYTRVQLQGPFLPGDVQHLPDARLTATANAIGDGTVEPAAVLAAKTNLALADRMATTIPGRTSLVGGQAIPLSNQALPTLLPMGWQPHSALVATGAGALWRGPLVEGGHLVSFGFGEAGWRIEQVPTTQWEQSLQAERTYAYVVPDVPTAAQAVGGPLQPLPEIGELSPFAVGDLAVRADPPSSIARRGITAIAVLADRSVHGWSGTRVEMYRDESYAALNPSEDDTVEDTLIQQAVLYRQPDGSNRAYLPLVPRRETLLAKIRVGRIGGPVRQIVVSPGVWVEPNVPRTVEPVAGYNLSASATERFWFKVEPDLVRTASVANWRVDGAFRLALEARAAQPVLTLSKAFLETHEAGRVALLQVSGNALGASYRVMGLLDGNGTVNLLPGRTWQDGRYLIATAPEPLITAQVRFNPDLAGQLRVADTPFGDRVPGNGGFGWVALTVGDYLLSGRGENLAQGELAVTAGGAGPLTWTLPIATPQLQLVQSVPENFADIGFQPSFFLAFNFPVDTSTATADNLIVRVNGEVRKMRWTWEQTNQRTQGRLRQLIDDETNHVLLPGDQLTIEGTAGVKAANGLLLAPFNVTYRVPDSLAPVPLNPENLYVLWDPANRTARVRLREPVGPQGTEIILFNDRTTGYASMIQVEAWQTMEARVDSRLLDPIAVTLISPSGDVVEHELTVYYRNTPSAERVETAIGPRGGTIEVPGVGAFSLPPGALVDTTEIVFAKASVEEPDVSGNPAVTTEFWTIDGLDTGAGVPTIGWTPEIQLDENGEPDKLQMLSQPLPHVPQWFHDHLVALGEPIPERPLMELASPLKNDTYGEMTVQFLSAAQLGEEPTGPSTKAGLANKFIGWGFTSFLAENRVAMAMHTILNTGGGEGMGAMKFGKVGAFDYKQTVVDGFGVLPAEEGDLIGGAWIMGPIHQTPGGRQYPVTIALTDPDGSYWASSGWFLPTDLQSIGHPEFATHPSFLHPAKKILFRDSYIEPPTTTIMSLYAHSGYWRRDFGFWYVDPDGGIGTARPPGLGLDLVDVAVIDGSGAQRDLLSTILRDAGKVPFDNDVLLTWQVDDDADLNHSAIARLNGEEIPSNFATEYSGADNSASKQVSVRIPMPVIGSHQLQLVVRNQYGLELYASFAFRVTPASGEDLVTPTPQAPFVLTEGVGPKPASDPDEIEDDEGLFEDGDLIFLPFSEPVVVDDPNQLGTFVQLRIFDINVGIGDAKNWPVNYLEPTNLDPVQAGVAMTGLYIEPLGSLPSDHVLELVVFPGDHIRDTGYTDPQDPTNQVDPLGLQAMDEFNGYHYQARWVTPFASAVMTDFTENAVIDYAAWGKYLFELSYTSGVGPEVVVYETTGTGQLRERKRVPVRETKAPGDSYFNRGARSIAFWPNPRAGSIPGYFAVGYQAVRRTIGGQAMVLRPTRMKFFNPNKEGLDALVGGYAVGNEQADNIRTMDIRDNLMLMNTVWGGIYVLDMEALRAYYEEGPGTNLGTEPGQEKPHYYLVKGINQPGHVIKERYFPFTYPAEFFISRAIGSPIQSRWVSVPRTGQNESGLELAVAGTGGIEMGAWFHGNPPIEILLTIFDAGYAPLDPDGDHRYDVASARPVQWDVDPQDRRDDRITYFSGDDAAVDFPCDGCAPDCSEGAPPVDTRNAFLGKAGLPEKFEPIYVRVMPQIQTSIMRNFNRDPMDVMIMRTNPQGEQRGGLMLAGAVDRETTEYFAFIQFEEPVSNLDVNPDKQMVAVLYSSGRLVVIDIPTWLDLALQWKNNPCQPDLKALNEQLADPAQANGAGDFLPGIVADTHLLVNGPKPMAFMSDRVVAGNGETQRQLILDPPLFINPGFYEDDALGTRTRYAMVETIAGVEVKESGAADEPVLDLKFGLREDARVQLYLLDRHGEEQQLWDSQSPLKSGRGANVHVLTFPLSKLGLSSEAVQGGDIPLALLSKLRLRGTPVKNPNGDETVRLWVDLQADPWGTYKPYLNQNGTVEPHTGRVRLEDSDLPSLPTTGIQMSMNRRYVSQGLWDGTVGRGWFMPWEAKLLWLVKRDANGTDQEWLELRLPNGEVVGAKKVDGAWEIQDKRFNENPNFQLRTNAYEPDPDLDDFPELVDVVWGGQEFQFEFVRAFGSADFANEPEKIKYSLNTQSGVANNRKLRVARFAISRWVQVLPTGEAGWQFWLEQGRVTRAEHLDKTYAVEMRYKRHDGNQRLGLQRATVTSEQLPGEFFMELQQARNEDDFLLLSRAMTNVRSHGDFRYEYTTRNLGIRDTVLAETRLLSRLQAPNGAETRYTWDDQKSQDNLPIGIAWPYVTQVNNTGFVQLTWQPTWHGQLAGRTQRMDLESTWNGTAESYHWSYDSDGFNTELGHNGGITTANYASWPTSYQSALPSGLSVTTYLDSLLRVTHTESDTGGPPANDTSYTYLGQTGLIKTITYADGLRESFDYDFAGRRIAIDDGLGGRAQILGHHDGTVLPRQMTDEFGVTETFDYDALGRTLKYQRLDHTETVTYTGSSFSKVQKGANGLNNRVDNRFRTTDNGYEIEVRQSPQDNISSPIVQTTKLDSWGNIVSMERNGETIYTASEFALGGPRKEVLAWQLNGVVKRSTYKKTRVGYVQESYTYDGQPAWEGTVNQAGQVIQSKDYSRGAMSETTYDNLGNLKSATTKGFTGEEILEMVTIDYLSPNSQRITRNGLVYDITFNPGSEWTRTITGATVNITETGRGDHYHDVFGQVNKKPVRRTRTISGNVETVSQFGQWDMPQTITKTLSGDQRVLEINTGSGVTTQEFTGLGQVKKTMIGEQVLYELLALDGHGRRTRWNSAGTVFEATYQKGYLASQKAGDVVTFAGSQWDHFGRPTHYSVEGRPIRVTYNLEQPITTEVYLTEAVEDLSAGSVSYRVFDGMGRAIKKILAWGDERPNWEWEWQYGKGTVGAEHNAPGDRLVRGFTPFDNGFVYYYNDAGQLIDRETGQPRETPSKYIRTKVEPRQWSFQYDDVTTETEPLRRTTSYGPLGLTKQRLFNQNGQLLQIQENGITLMDREYDALGRVIREVDHQGRIRTMRYDGNTRRVIEEVLTAEDQAQITLRGYDDLGQLTDLRQRVRRDENGQYIGGVHWRYEYDNFGRRYRTMRKDEAGDFQLWEENQYDAVTGDVVQRIDAAGVTWQFVYDPVFGRLSRRTNSAGLLETWTHAANGRDVTYQRGNYKVFIARDEVGRVIEQTVNDIQTWTYAYAPLLPTPAVENHPDGRVVERTFDAYGNVDTVTFRHNGETRSVDMGFDSLDRLVFADDGTGQRVDFQYDERGFLAAEAWQVAPFTQPLETSYRYDDRGNQTGVIYPSGRHLQRVFDGAGRVAALYEGGRRQAAFQYNLDGQLASVIKPDGASTYLYDNFGRLQRHITDFAGSAPSRREDLYGYGGGQGHPDAVTSHTLQWGDVYLSESFDYNPRNMLQRHEVQTVQNIPGMVPGVTQYTYGDMDRVTQISSPYGDMSYVYGNDGRINTQSFQGMTTHFTYDGGGRLLHERETDADGVDTGYERHLQYDVMGQLTSIQEAAPGGTLRTQQFRYDMFGRMRAQRNADDPAADWAVYTLSPPVAGEESPLSFPLAGTNRVAEVMLTSTANRELPQTLGFAYGPAGLNHMVTAPSQTWSQGSVTSHFTDAHQNTVAVMSPQALAAPGGGSHIAAATFWDHWGNGVSLQPDKLLSDLNTPLNGPVSASMLFQNQWDLTLGELGFGDASNGDELSGGDAWRANLLHQLIPGFGGKLQVGGYLDSAPAATRQAISGLPVAAHAPLVNMDTRLYSPDQQSFAAPDQWSMFRPEQDPYTANRYLYANMNPVMNWDADGRITSLKLAMGYSSFPGNVGDIMLPQPLPPFDDSEIWNAFWDSTQQLLGITSMVTGVLSYVPGLQALRFVAFGADGLDFAISAFRRDAVGAALSAFGAVGSLGPGDAIGREGGLLRRIQNTANDPAFERAALVADGVGLGVMTAALLGGASLDTVSRDGVGLSGSILEAQALVRGQGTCFVAGTAVATADGDRPIDSLRPGDRVLTYADKDMVDAVRDEDVANDVSSDESTLTDTEVEPENWRLIRFQMRKDGAPDDLIHIHALRPVSWIEANSVEADKWIYLVLSDIALEGPALVAAIEPCPPIQPGPGAVVLTTYTTTSDDVVALTFDDGEAPMQITVDHQLFSLDRADFVPVKQLQVGERLRTLDGETRLLDKTFLPGEHRVHNLEVESTHNYYTTASRVLGHNTNFSRMLYRQDANMNWTKADGTPVVHPEEGLDPDFKKWLRGKTPTKGIREMVNQKEGWVKDMDDPVLAGQKVNKRFQADHVVAMERITKMEGFRELSYANMKRVLNCPENFIGLSASANASKQDQTFEAWTKHKSKNIPVNADFRKKMMKEEKRLTAKLVSQITRLLASQ